MAPDPRTHPDRLDTKLAKRADLQIIADEVWSEVSQEQKRRDENTARLKAARLARDGNNSATADQHEQEKLREP